MNKESINPIDEFVVNCKFCHQKLLEVFVIHARAGEQEVTVKCPKCKMKQPSFKTQMAAQIGSTDEYIIGDILYKGEINFVKNFEVVLTEAK